MGTYRDKNTGYDYEPGPLDIMDPFATTFEGPGYETPMGIDMTPWTPEAARVYSQFETAMMNAVTPRRVGRSVSTAGFGASRVRKGRKK